MILFIHFAISLPRNLMLLKLLDHTEEKENLYDLGGISQLGVENSPV